MAAVWCALAVAGCGGGDGDGDAGRVFDRPGGSAVARPSSAPPSFAAPSAVARDAEPLRFLPVASSVQGPCPGRTALGASPGAYATYRDATTDTCYVVTPDSGMTARPAWAKASYETSGAGWVVTVGLTARDRARFAQLTGTLAARQPPRNQLAMVREGTLLSAPSVAQALTGGTVQISGSFTGDSARQLARDIRGG
ncbi:hypothetical protein [Streptomyces sp. NPDC059850]|uniref:SecDF P1 head subdomain-containing protein n=1 Tax=Streptomyces sp. NPDC059850 TaxID=3346970 RepID=UPI00365EEE1E